MKKELQEVRAKVIEAVPEIVEFDPRCPDCKEWLGKDEKDGRWFCGSCPLLDSYKTPRTHRLITLADVLRAIRNVPQEITPMMVVRPLKNTWWDKQEHKLLEIWNLALPLDEQEPEVIEFLAKILL